MLRLKKFEITAFLGFLDIHNAEDFIIHVDINNKTFLGPL